MTATEAPEAPSTVPARRPPGVLVLAILVGLQGIVLTLAGIALIVARDDAEAQADLEAGATSLAVTGGVVAVLGIVSATVSIGLLRRSSLARSVCTIVALIQSTTSVYALVALQDIRGGTLWSFAVSVAVLWFLYGSERTQAYFAR